MADTRKDKEPATPTFSQDSGEAGANRDGRAVYSDVTTFSGSPLSGFRQYRRTIAELRTSVKAVEEAANSAVVCAYKLELPAWNLAEAAEQDDQPRAVRAVQEFNNALYLSTHETTNPLERNRYTTPNSGFDRFMAATAALESAVKAMCQVLQLDEILHPEG